MVGADACTVSREGVVGEIDAGSGLGASAKSAKSGEQSASTQRAANLESSFPDLPSSFAGSAFGFPKNLFRRSAMTQSADNRGSLQAH